MGDRGERLVDSQRGACDLCAVHSLEVDQVAALIDHGSRNHDAQLGGVVDRGPSHERGKGKFDHAPEATAPPVVRVGPGLVTFPRWWLLPEGGDRASPLCTLVR